MWYFFTITAQLTLQQCLQHIFNIYIRYCLQLHYLSILTLLLHMLSFSQYDIVSQLLHNWIYNNVYSISATYTYSTIYNDSPQYTIFAVYICFLFTVWYFFTITAQLTLQQCLQHILNIYIRYCYQLHYLSILTLLLHMLSFSQYDIFSQLLHNWIYNNVYSISATYTYSTVYNYSPQYTAFAVYICFPFHNVNIFHTLLYNCLYDNVYIESSM